MRSNTTVLGNRRRTLRFAAAALTVAAGLSLTACGNGDSGNDASAKDSSPASSSSSSSSSEGGSTAGDAKAGSGEDTTAEAAENGATKTSTKVTFCKTEDLAIDAVDAAPDETEGRIDITMINRGSTTCSATGFAGVDIKDADHTTSPIERGPAQPRVTTLKPGDAAVFNLAYTIDTTGNSLASPTDILVTPPNETHTVTLDWPAAAGDIKGAYTDVQVYPTHTTK
ncbi:DUF4232 domain-containing protein [Streptomyces kunmingensis]|uniref:DUF4232 domain-containing protein n=1 Tax=Streptomyces kunmingensis TaxID=68225 RepID=A0ABU6C8F2_9ACTN|nr:DUF4232 domain-containing protein [Streptomyces kunmingensis]MEB3960998.1 DUF4232 domain-containing protein [Streptomyces kunmingensis]